MKKEIMVDINPYQTRVVLLEDSAPSEIYIERRGRERLVGNIYNGKVQNVLPGMQAAFVDIGLERNAFLYAGDIRLDRSDFQFGTANGNGTDETCIQPTNIRDIVKPGQDIMVQVLKEPVGTKGARVTTHITLPGRTLVLMPTVNYVGVSRRIDDEAERVRLRGILEDIKPADMGVIVRTVAAGKERAEFETDLDFLVRLWQRIRQKNDYISAPCLLHAEESLIFRTIRDLFMPDVDRLTINNREFFECVQIVAEIISPVLKEKVALYEGEEPLFDRYGLEEEIDKTLARKVWLDNGGYIVIDQTEALTSIDVNTGRFVGNDSLQETILKTNCQAAKEIARQLRLRDLSGIIIIDFIDMENEEDKALVVETLKEALKNDRTKTNVLGITQLGLVEMTRKRMRQCISNTLQVECPYCKGDGRVLSVETTAMKIARKLEKTLREAPNNAYLIQAHPEVAEMIEDHSKEQSPFTLLSRYNCQIFLRANAGLHMEEYDIEPIHGKADITKLDGARLYR